MNELCCICGNISITKSKQTTDTCKEYIYTDITNTILTQTQALTNNKNVIERAAKIQPSLEDLNSAFSTVHCAISHTEPTEPSSVTKMEAQIDKNRSIYRKMSPFKIIPKQHILEKHCSRHIKKGCAGSDGGEGNREQSPNDFINRKRQSARNQKRSSQITPHINSTFTPDGAFSPKLNCDKYTSPKLNYDNI